MRVTDDRDIVGVADRFEQLVYDYTGLEVYRDYKPGKDSYEFCVYFKVHGEKFRIDYEVTAESDPEKSFEDFRRIYVRDVVLLWMAGPDKQQMLYALKDPSE